MAHLVSLRDWSYCHQPAVMQLVVCLTHHVRTHLIEDTFHLLLLLRSFSAHDSDYNVAFAI
jgi:hypothetical protein